MIQIKNAFSEAPKDRNQQLISQLTNQVENMKGGFFPDLQPVRMEEISLGSCLNESEELATNDDQVKSTLVAFWIEFERLILRAIEKVKSPFHQYFGTEKYVLENLRMWQELAKNPNEYPRIPFPENIQKLLTKLPLDNYELEHYQREVIRMGKLLEHAKSEKKVTDQITLGRTTITEIISSSGIPLETEISGDVVAIKTDVTSRMARDIRDYLYRSKKQPEVINTTWKELAILEGEEIYEVFMAARQFQQNPQGFTGTLIQRRSFDRYQFQNRRLIAVELDLSTEEFEKFRRLLYL